MTYVYVLDSSNNPLMPTKRCGKVRWLLKTKQAVVVKRKPFTIRLCYEPKTHVVQDITLGVKPGRTHIGLAAVRTDGKCLFAAECVTRNKEIPKRMMERRMHRMASRRGERLVRKRRAKKNHTLMKDGQIERVLPGYQDGSVLVKDIINTEARFNNRHRDAGWLTPTARHLLQTHIRLARIVCEILPVSSAAMEMDLISFMELECGGKLKSKEAYKRGPMCGYKNQKEALYDQQNGLCLLCGKAEIEHIHHIMPKSKGGSDTLKNKAGLCCACHMRVHQDEKMAARLLRKKNGLNKKYGALSVLNQINGRLADSLSSLFSGNLYLDSGAETKRCREEAGFERTKSADAYCIACAGRKITPDVRTDFTDQYQIRQFARHARSLISRQTERTYRLLGTVVAKNRRPRCEQKGEALSDWYERMCGEYGQKEAERMRSMLCVKKSRRSYNNPGRVLPGAECLYHKKHFILGKQDSGGKYYYPLDQKERRIPSKDVTVLSQKGLVFVA